MSWSYCTPSVHSTSESDKLCNITHRTSHPSSWSSSATYYKNRQRYGVTQLYISHWVFPWILLYTRKIVMHILRHITPLSNFILHLFVSFIIELLGTLENTNLEKSAFVFSTKWTVQKYMIFSHKKISNYFLHCFRFICISPVALHLLT